MGREYKCSICSLSGHNARSSKFHGLNKPVMPGELNSEIIRLLKREIEGLHRKLRTRVAIEELVLEATKQLVAQPVNVEIPPAPPSDRRREVDTEMAMLHISDTQIGKITDTYNSKIAEDRLIKLVEKTISITKLRRNCAKIDEIHVYLGGDIVEGSSIFPGQAHLIDSDVFEQAVRTAPAILTKCILMLLQEFPKVKVLCVPGNHGRNGSKHDAGYSKNVNWDNVAYAMTRAALMSADPDLLKRLDFKENKSWYAIDNILGWQLLIVHGDQINGYSGFPFSGVSRKIWGWIDSIPEPFDFCAFGHFHTYASAVLNHRIFLANGTTESDNDFAQEELAACGYPCQRLSFFNKKHGLIADHQIFLTSDRIPQKLKAERWLVRN